MSDNVVEDGDYLKVEAPWQSGVASGVLWKVEIDAHGG